LAGFPRELLVVRKVLILAAAAFAEERAARLDAVLGRREDFYQIRVRAVFVIPENPRFHHLAGE
jgi:hypothetical protein